MSQLDDTLREQKRLASVAQLHADEARERMDWRKHLRRTSSGRELLGDVHNIRLAFEHAPELAGLLRYNELARRVELTRAPPWRTLSSGASWRDDDDIDLVSWLQQWNVPARGDATISRIVHAEANRSCVHPVRDWLGSLEWDGEPRIVEVLIEVLCAKGDSIYLAGALRRFLISAVARVMRPGCQADHMLVLVGGQGGGKSTFARVLGAPWTVESHSTFGSKDAAQELDGAWIVEVAELSGMRKSEVEVVKNFISKQSDHYRPAYGRHVIDQPRTCVFIGTTNEEKFLVDYTGNRRFWPIRCDGRINVKLLTDARDQLWAEARSAFEAGEQWHLSAEEARIAANVQESHRVVSEVEQGVANILERKVKGGWTVPPTVSVLELFREICGVERDTENLSARRQMETAIGQAVKRSGWVSVGRRGEYRSTTYQYVPPDPAANLSNPY